MSKPEVSAKKALQDIGSGLDNKALMEKYHLSPKGLRSLMKKMVAAGLMKEEDFLARDPLAKKEEAPPKKEEASQTEAPPKKKRREAARKPDKEPDSDPKPQLDLQSVARDVLGGIGDSTLRIKYRISQGESLEPLYTRLLDAGMLSAEDFYERLAAQESDYEEEEELEVEPEPEEEIVRRPPPPIGKPRDHDMKQMMRAAQEGNADRVGQFLKVLDVNSKDKFGDTPLIVASDYGRLNVVKLLLENGADVDLADADGKSAIEYARERKNLDIVELLEKHISKE